NGAPAGADKKIDSLSADPAIKALRVGGPGSGGGARFRGDIAELRVYNRPLTEIERKQVENELQQAWFAASDPKVRASDPLAILYDELISERGPFWVSPQERAKLLPPEE